MDAMNEHSNTNGSGSQANAAPPRRTIGLWMATALVVGNMIGSGVFLLPSSLAAAAGPVSLLGWVFTDAGAVLLALVFANLGRAFPAARPGYRAAANPRRGASLTLQGAQA
jgi:APA family basic amino acid/polyamine antiporter